MAGYSFRGRMGERRSSSLVFKNEARHDGQRLVLSFLDLIEARFVKVFLDQGVSLHTIRIVAQEAEVMFKTTPPFCVKKFETDGETILARLRDEPAAGGERLLDLKRKHFVFPAVFNPLLKTLDYDTGDAIRWPRGPRPDPPRPRGSCHDVTLAESYVTHGGRRALGAPGTRRRLCPPRRPLSRSANHRRGLGGHGVLACSERSTHTPRG